MVPHLQRVFSIHLLAHSMSPQLVWARKKLCKAGEECVDGQVFHTHISTMTASIYYCTKCNSPPHPPTPPVKFDLLSLRKSGCNICVAVLWLIHCWNVWKCQVEHRKKSPTTWGIAAVLAAPWTSITLFTSCRRMRMQESGNGNVFLMNSGLQQAQKQENIYASLSSSQVFTIHKVLSQPCGTTLTAYSHTHTHTRTHRAGLETQTFTPCQYDTALLYPLNITRYLSFKGERWHHTWMMKDKG